MPDRTQDLKNHRQVTVACKSYTDSKIADLKWELGTYDLSISNDSTSALTKTMPSGTLNFNVNEVEGASEVSENLIVLSDVAETTTNGITYKVENGVVYLSGTCNSNALIYFNFNNTLVNGNSYSYNQFTKIAGYSVNLAINGGTSPQYNILASNGTTTSATFTANSDYNNLFIYIENGTTISATSFTPMLVEGSTAPTTFKQGFTGIHNFEWTGVKVEGANLCQTPTYNGVMNNTEAKGVNFGVLPNGTYSISFNVSANSGNRTFNIYRFYNGVLDTQNYFNTNLNGTGAKTYTFTLDSTIPYDNIVLGINTSSNDYSITLDSIMLNYGNTAKTYAEYVAPTTKTIDLSTILYNGSPLFDGNSLKAVNDVKDSITPYKATKKLGYVDLGSLNWSMGGKTPNDNYRIITSDLINLIKPTISVLNIAKMLCVKYKGVAINDTYYERDGFSISTDGRIFIYDSNYNQSTSATAFKTAMSGVYLVYELATPIEVSIDWSATLRNIQGYSNGTITFTNTYDMAVSSDVDYLIEEVKA